MKGRIKPLHFRARGALLLACNRLPAGKRTTHDADKIRTAGRVCGSCCSHVYGLGSEARKQEVTVKFHVAVRGKRTLCQRIIASPHNRVQHIDPTKNRMATDIGDFFAKPKRERCPDCESHLPKDAALRPPAPQIPASSSRSPFGCSISMSLSIGAAAAPSIEPLEAHYAQIGDRETPCKLSTSGPSGAALLVDDPKRVTCPTCLEHVARAS